MTLDSLVCAQSITDPFDGINVHQNYAIFAKPGSAKSLPCDKFIRCKREGARLCYNYSMNQQVIPPLDVLKYEGSLSKMAAARSDSSRLPPDGVEEDDSRRQSEPLDEAARS